jgi:hypothetical protein
MSLDGGSSDINLMVKGALQSTIDDNQDNVGALYFLKEHFGTLTVGTPYAGADAALHFKGLIDEIVIYNTPISPNVAKNNFCALEALVTTDASSGSTAVPDTCLQ